MEKHVFLSILLTLIMILPAFSLITQTEDINAHPVKNESNFGNVALAPLNTPIDRFVCSDKSYDYANFTLQNLDYNISTTKGTAGSVINMANNFTGAYYIQNNGTLVEQNFIGNNISYLAKSPLLYLKYNYLNYNGEYYGEMPYYNNTNVLKWIFIYGTNPKDYFEIWGFNLVNNTVINYTETNLSMLPTCNSNFQLTYVGNGNFIGIGGGESNYYVWNFYEKTLVYFGTDPFYIVEANNIYFIPQYDEFVDVWADGTRTDNIQYARIGINGEISKVYNITTNQTYKINGVFDIIVDVNTNDIWINDGAGSYGLIIILHWTGSSFDLVSQNYTSSDLIDNSYNDYAVENNYIHIITDTGCIQSGSGGYGSPAQFFINEFQRTATNITGLSGNDIRWATSAVAGDGAPIGIQLPEVNNSNLNSSYYGMWLNTSSKEPHVFYVWNSSEPESIASYLRKDESLQFQVKLREKGLPIGTSWSVTLNRTTESSTTCTITFTEPNGTYLYAISNISGYSVSPSAGSINVSGNNTLVAINFTSVRTNVTKYTITFGETNLPAGQEWYVNLTNYVDSGPITGSSYSLSLTNGTYYYIISTSNKIYSPSTSSGSFYVNGSSLLETITFSEVKYSITFKESGLPLGIAWYVNLTNGNDSMPIMETSYSFYLINGTYSYIIVTLDKRFKVSSASTPFEVKGSSLTVSVQFSELFTVTFTESGLPASAVWYVNLTNYIDSGPITGSSFTMLMTNGTYSYEVSLATGYTVSPSSGSIVVSGSNISNKIIYKAVSPNEITTVGTPDIETYGVIVSFVIIAAIGLSVMVIRKRK